MILDRYLVRQFMPIFLVAISMFVLLLCMIDLFSNLVRYLNNGVSTSDILLVSYYYLPKSFSYALPMSLLFAAAYSLGDLYARNELTSIFCAGVPFWRFSVPLLVIGILASVFAFSFNDIVVIPTYKMKNDLSRSLLNERPSDENRTDIVIKARQGRLTYAVDYFDYPGRILNGLTIIEHDQEGNFIYLIRARSARWTGDHWALNNAVIYEWDDDFLVYSPLEYTDEYREDPETFRRNMANVEELRYIDAWHLIRDLQAAGLPFLTELTDTHQRLSFSTVSFVVIILSISMGGRFRKNILLMSLLSSLGGAVIFYVMEMLSMMMAKTGYISPFIGAWFPVVSFIFIGILLLRSAKT